MCCPKWMKKSKSKKKKERLMGGADIQIRNWRRQNERATRGGMRWWYLLTDAFIDKKLMTEVKWILAWILWGAGYGIGSTEKASPGWLGWAEVCLLSQQGRSGAAVSMPTTGWVGLQCSTCPQHLPGCSCRQSWVATTPTHGQKGVGRLRQEERQFKIKQKEKKTTN